MDRPRPICPVLLPIAGLVAATPPRAWTQETHVEIARQGDYAEESGK